MEKTSPFESLYNIVETIKMPFRILILVGSMLLLGGAFVFFSFVPKDEEISRLRTEIKGLEQKINRAKIRENSLVAFEKEQAEVKAQFQEALRLLPNEREIASLLRNITQLGSDSNLLSRSFSPKPEVDQGFYVEIPVSMTFSGNYHDVAVFFGKVGLMERIVNIVNVSMIPAEDYSTTLTTTCEAVTYRFRGEADEATE